MGQNFPNPFNPNTKIKLDLPSDGYVTLRVYNSTGQLVTTLLDGFADKGTKQLVFNGTDFPSGVYFYSLNAGEFSQAKKMVLVK